MAGTIKEVISSQPEIALLKITSFRPFPSQEIKEKTKQAKNVIIIDKAISPGEYGPLATEVRSSLSSEKINIQNYIAGLGGCDISEKIINKLIKNANKPFKKPQFIF